jgi:hypothetical protein
MAAAGEGSTDSERESAHGRFGAEMRPNLELLPVATNVVPCKAKIGACPRFG